MFTPERIEELNNERLKLICPTPAAKVRQVIALAKTAGYSLLITQALRTIAEQNALFAQGRTKPGKVVTNARGGQSWHNYGLAVDLVFVNSGEADWHEKLYKKLGGWAKEVELEWGGNWKSIVDLPHVQQIDGMTTAQAAALYKSGGFAAVWARIK